MLREASSPFILFPYQIKNLPEYDQLTSIDEDCAKDEEKVDENPAGEGRYALGHLSYQGMLKFYAFVAVKYIGPFITL